MSIRSGAIIEFDAGMICKAIERAFAQKIDEVKEEIISVLEDALFTVYHGFYQLLLRAWRWLDIYTDSGAESKPRRILPFPICVRLLDTVYRECTGKYRKTYLRRPQDRSENGSSVYSFPVVTAQ